MIQSLVALTVTMPLLVTTAPSELPDHAQSIRGQANENGESVDILGRHDRTYERGPNKRPRAGEPVASERPQGTMRGGGETTEQEPCIPRIRTLDGVDQPGHVCPDDSNGLIWVPDTDADSGDPAAAQPPPLVVTSEDVQTLLVDAGTVQVQPDRSWVLVNAETIVHTDAAEHILTTQVLGIDVEVRATPVEFTWDFGDGSEPLTRAEPGAPWPDHTTAHKYQTTGDFAVTLRTQWDAHFRVQGASSWRPVTGTPVTVATSEPFEAVTASPRLTR